jgi:hypothetical protein
MIAVLVLAGSGMARKGKPPADPAIAHLGSESGWRIKGMNVDGEIAFFDDAIRSEHVHAFVFVHNPSGLLYQHEQRVEDFGGQCYGLIFAQKDTMTRIESKRTKFVDIGFKKKESATNDTDSHE